MLTDLNVSLCLRNSQMNYRSNEYTEPKTTRKIFVHTMMMGLYVGKNKTKLKFIQQLVVLTVQLIFTMTNLMKILK